jgi:hypothetical protein
MVRTGRSEVIGKWAQRYRLGARYCSNACRQKAYRRRQHNENPSSALADAEDHDGTP